MWKTCSLGVALLTLAAAPIQVHAAPTTGVIRIQPDQTGPAGTVQTPGPNVPYVGGPAKPSDYWLGIECLPVPAALRAHLNLPEKKGLLVGGVAKNSPAAAAGIAQYDVLVRAGDKPLAEPRDLIAAVDAAKQSKLKIETIRGGRPRTVEATPAKRPEQIGAAPLRVPDQADWDTVQNWMDGMMASQGGGNAGPNFQFRAFGPGEIVPNTVLVGKPMPANLSVSISKVGDQPAKIVVQRDKDKWDLAEKDIDKLPADVRPFVERMLGHGMSGVVGGVLPNGTLQLPVLPPMTMQARPFAGALDPQLQKRFDEMNQRMDKMMKMMEEINEGHAPKKILEQP